MLYSHHFLYYPKSFFAKWAHPLIRQIFVVENRSDLKFEGFDGEIVHVDDYLTGQSYQEEKNIQVVNLCRKYSYLSVGYYCSLLAEARGHRVLIRRPDGLTAAEVE